MHLRWLELLQWRNYEHAYLTLGPGVHLVTGSNGHGKTNILEAIHYLALGRSHRVSDDQALIRASARECLIRAELEEGNHRQRIEFGLSRAARNRARVDGVERARHEVLGRIRIVMFAPEDLVLVRGDPADRRRFLDDVLAQRRPAYRKARHEYERALRQRNALLRELRQGTTRDDGALTVWSEELIRLGARIVAARLMACATLRQPASALYARLAGQDEHACDLQLVLERSTGHGDAMEPDTEPDVTAITEQLRSALAARAEEERERGTSLVGPHRDDVRIELEGLPVRTHASQGEAWSVALALRLASRELLHTSTGHPVTLLDDVFAQLDDDRRRRLATWCGDCEQVLISTAVAADVPLRAHQLHVHDGSVRRVADAEEHL